jgi:hypothetical protein
MVTLIDAVFVPVTCLFGIGMCVVHPLYVSSKWCAPSATYVPKHIHKVCSLCMGTWGPRHLSLVSFVQGNSDSISRLLEKFSMRPVMLLLLPLALQPFVGFGFLRQVTLVWDFIARGVFQGKVAGLTSKPKPGGPVHRIYIPLGQVAQLYPQALGSSGT